MSGVVTAIVLFLLACLIWPQLVRDRPQYYAAFGCVLAIILIDTIILMFSAARTVEGASFAARASVFGGVINGLLTILALVLCLLSAGGMTLQDLTGEIRDSYKAVRRDGPQGPILIPPRTGQVGKADPNAPADAPESASGRTRPS
ncbi:MAG: hypothetical protein NZ561_11495 [Phycisphaerae bacterium]|nr:hypothetical protein [Phycisphaerae bacterium]MDW8261956.1 hypothetical protein [Phycisphaerales bacterium]